MKKKKNIIGILLILVISLFTTGCGSKKTISAEQFKEKLEAKNFILSDASNQFANYDYIKQVYIAQNPNKTYQIEYYFFADASRAKNFYEHNKGIFKKIGTVRSNSEITIANHSKYSQTAGGKFSVISRIENTVIYVNVNTEYKDEVTKILKELNY